MYGVVVVLAAKDCGLFLIMDAGVAGGKPEDSSSITRLSGRAAGKPSEVFCLGGGAMLVSDNG